MNTMLSRKAPMIDQNEHAMIQFAKLITTPADTESQVVIVTSKVGLVTIGRIQSA